MKSSASPSEALPQVLYSVSKPSRLRREAPLQFVGPSLPQQHRSHAQCDILPRMTPDLRSRLCHLHTPRLAAVLLVALAWSSPAFCGEIHDAARDGDLAKATAWLKGHPSLAFSKDNGGETPLHWATFNGHTGTAELLRQHGGHE